MNFYSQIGQDYYIYNKFFKNIKDGFYVDIGAHDGKTASNTLFFDELGWKGVCVEPIYDRFLELEKNRTSKNYNCVISNIDSEYVDFCKIDGYAEMLSGIVENYSENHKQRILNECESHKCKKEKLKIKNEKFSNIVKEKNINFLSLDTEGGEEKILESIDFNEYYIDIICFEDNGGFNLENSKLKEWYIIDNIISNQDIVLKRKNK
jgi:FkbM family methyltransferase